MMPFPGKETVIFLRAMLQCNENLLRDVRRA